MRLNKLEILGFKSFRDKTPLDFSSGISAIVGPNGCGKSNILDTIRWVMGEQSARLLRGKKMEDVIFNGSDDAPPVNMAEVSITLSNDSLDFPGAYADCSEVMITRRIFREAESEYFINKVPCRLLDVREFFMDTGVGARTYSIVEQGSVANLIEAKPEDRRIFIEEAAGIRKYKSRKESASRKMEATRQNILRLNDIVREVKSQLNSISRQAKRAERYKVLRKELKEAEVLLSLQQFMTLLEQQEAGQSAVAALSGRNIEIRTELQGIEAAVEELRIESAENESLLNRLQENIFRIKNDINIKEKGIEFARAKADDLTQRKEQNGLEIEMLRAREGEAHTEIAALEAQLGETEQKIAAARVTIAEQEQIAEDLRKEEKATHRELEEQKVAYFDRLAENARLKNMLLSLSKGVEDLKKRSDRESKDIEESSRRIEGIRESLTHLTLARQDNEAVADAFKEKEDEVSVLLDQGRLDLKSCEERIAALKEESGRKAARFLSLKEFQEGYLWCSEATRSIMKGKDQVLTFGSVCGLVADHLEVPKEYEVAVEAVLGEKLQYVVVKNQEDGVMAIDYLKTHASGRGSFIPMEVRSDAGIGSPDYLTGTVKLLDQVGVRNDFQNIAAYLLGDVLLIPNLQTGISLWQKNGFRGTFVTPEGDIISPHGVLTGGNGMNGDSSLLRNKREILELEEEMERLSQRLTDATNDRDRLGRSHEETNQELDRIRTDLHALEIEMHKGEKDIEGLENELRWVEQHLNVQRFNRETLVSEEGQAVERIVAVEGEIAANEEGAQRLDEAVASLKERWEKSREDLAALERRLTEEKILLRALDEKSAAGRETLTRLRTAANHLAAEIDAKVHDIDACASEISEMTSRMEEERASLTLLYDDHRVTDEDLSCRTVIHREKEEALRRKEAGGQEVKRELDRLLAEFNERQMELQGITFHVEALKRSVQEKHQVDLEGLKAGSEKMDAARVEELTTAIAEKSKAVEDFGEVNLLALSEHETLKERYDFLTAQVTDLNASLEALQQTISRINRISRKRFAETFEAINTCFKEVFPKLFPGGRGELKLTDESDLLETGVDIELRIPGKKTQNVSLLSGGEKALSAVALIFSIILYRPTPFLILDEVDAALDDANIALFNGLLQDVSRMSQIILITHNKRTMEVADTLYGVTMEKDGISSLVSVNLQ